MSILKNREEFGGEDPKSSKSHKNGEEFDGGGNFAGWSEYTPLWLSILLECCRELPDRVLNFIRSHPLMDEEVDHEAGAPVYYKRDVVFSHLVVDKVLAGGSFCFYRVGLDIRHTLRFCRIIRMPVIRNPGGYQVFCEKIQP